ncbi:DUF2845 domain-containing protein [Legionella rubrilucens]|uniref:DUF2845 domain-containing protein n=1 Tax=Legionella rubrilucens TaxID=458 RepID=UPI00138F8C2B|nr:DUF2845 domain-containing protein [Legionella rubrilucens]
MNRKFIKTVVGIVFCVTWVNAWALRCQTTIISPGLSLDEVKSLCGEPFEESEKKEHIVCAQGLQYSCQKIYTQTLIYKRPSTFIIEFQDDKVFSVALSPK